MNRQSLTEIQMRLVIEGPVPGVAHSLQDKKNSPLDPKVSQAGGHDLRWSRRMKVDVHDIPQPLLDGAVAGKRLVGRVTGTGKDGTPACATVPVSWRLA